MAAVEESTSKKEIPVATPSEISVQNNLILEAKPMTEDQPEYKAIENYALAAGGEKGIIGPICNKIKLLLAKSAP